MTRKHTITVNIETCEFMGIELIGVYGIKQLSGVGSAAVSNWQTRETDFPLPVIDLPGGGNDARGGIRLWRYTEIETWLVSKGKLKLS